MSDIVETKGTQPNQIKHNPYDANYKLIAVSYTHLDVYKRQY